MVGVNKNYVDNTVKQSVAPYVSANSVTITPAMSGQTLSVTNTVATAKTLGIIGKNMMPITASSITSNGITFTVNADKSITITGTASATAYFNLQSALKKYLRGFVGKNLIVKVYMVGTRTTASAWLANGNWQNQASKDCVFPASTGLVSKIIYGYGEGATDYAYLAVSSGCVINATVYLSIEQYDKTTATQNTYETFSITEQAIGASATVSISSIPAGKTLFVEEDTTTEFVFTYSGKIPIASNVLFGKIALWAGDSITYGAWRPTPEDYLNTGWCRIIRDNNNMIMGSYGVGGTTIAKRDGVTSSILERIPTMKTAYPNADYIIFQGSPNDPWESVPLGVIVATGTGGTYVAADYDTTCAIYDQTTFIGALESIFALSIANWPGKKVGYITTHKIPSAMNATYNFTAFMEAAVTVCKKWSIPCLDLFNESNLNFMIPAIATAYSNSADGTHPNHAGYLILANQVEAWLRSL